MMHTWALMKNGRVCNTVTTLMPLDQVKEFWPDYEVKELFSLPANVLDDYEFWNERP